jgi:CheY-like chemotaxis protein
LWRNLANPLCRSVGIIAQIGEILKTSSKSSCRSCFKKLEGDGKFDLIFSDIIMPKGMNGVELAQIVRLRFPTIPVLLTTGYAGVSIPSEYSGTLLRKPYKLQDLAKAIARVRGAFR